MKNDTNTSPKVLLVGYNGANNTGAEARLLAIIEDIRTILGVESFITIPTLNEHNLRRYLKEDSNLRIAPIPSIFFSSIRKLVREHDLVLLVEGSTYMDTWTSALLWFFLWATQCAVSMGKPCLAYAVDAGDLSTFNRTLVKHVASKTDLIITRTDSAAERLKSWGVTAPIEATTDTAYTFHTNTADENFIKDTWPENYSGIAGIAPVDFYLWPVVIRPWDKKEYCYKWPYYFSHSPERNRLSDKMANILAAEADRIIKDFGKSVALICMEEVDEPFAGKILKNIENKDRARIFSSRQYNASQMTVLLNNLEFLITSRYHAGVLSLPAKVPQTALGHDRRLKDYYHEMGLDEFFIDYSLAELPSTIKKCVDRLFSNDNQIREKLAGGYENHMAKSARNRELLRAFMEKHGWKVKG